MEFQAALLRLGYSRENNRCALTLDRTGNNAGEIRRRWRGRIIRAGATATLPANSEPSHSSGLLVGGIGESTERY